MGQSIDVAIKQKSKVFTFTDWQTIGIYYYSDKRYQLGIQIVSIGGGIIFDTSTLIATKITEFKKYQA